MIEALLTVTLLLVSETTTYVRPHTAEALYAPVTPEMAVSEALQEGSVVLPDAPKKSCSCVTFARKYIPNLPRVITASEYEPNAPPTIGGAVIMDYDGVGHIAVITGFPGGNLAIIEANYKKCEVTERVISFDDEHIIGYYVP